MIRKLTVFLELAALALAMAFVLALALGAF